MKPERWCCICERYITDTDAEVRTNELVAHEPCYLRAKKFFDSRNRTSQSSETHPCEIALAEYMFGPDLCGQPATNQVDCGYGCMHWVCDEHVQAQEWKGTAMYTIVVVTTSEDCNHCLATGVVEAKSVKATKRGLKVTLLNGEVYPCRLLPEEVALHFEWSGR